MRAVQNWAMAVFTLALILLGPLIAFVVVVMLEMLTDAVAQLGVTIVLPVAAGAISWVLLRKFRHESHGFQWRSEGA
jgi:hypothetical protein